MNFEVLVIILFVIVFIWLLILGDSLHQVEQRCTDRDVVSRTKVCHIETKQLDLDYQLVPRLKSLERFLKVSYKPGKLKDCTYHIKEERK